MDNVVSDSELIEIYKRIQDEGFSVAGLPCVRFGRAVIEAYETNKSKQSKQSSLDELKNIFKGM